MIVNPALLNSKLPELSNPGDSGDILFSKQAIDQEGNVIIGTIPSLRGKTYTPGRSNITIGAGQYLSGNQIIQGSSSLISSNIKDGVNIFGIVGNLQSGFGYYTTVTTGYNYSNTISIPGVLQKPSHYAILRNPSNISSGNGDSIIAVYGQWGTTSWIFAWDYDGNSLGIKGSFSYSGTTAKITLTNDVFMPEQEFIVIMV